MMRMKLTPNVRISLIYRIWVLMSCSAVPAQTIDYMWAISEGNGDLFWKELGIEVEQEDKRPKLDNEDDDSQ